ncbi:MAG: GMC family oxidoreductase [Verrucomicrobiae bacterium]|nr:GMC family oxidoreductase [Verrucomicrobiae bacterium]
MQLATLGFDLFGLVRGGKRFHRQTPEQRQRQILAWKNSRLGFQRDLIRYFESLATLALYNRAESPSTTRRESEFPRHAGPQIDPPPSELRAEVVVIGSGPGGAITACLLAEAGRDVLLIEEGPFLPLASCAPFSQAEMEQKYRNGGQTVAMGRNKISYVEGRCVGGGSEINSGLYHRTPPDILERWRSEFEVEALTEKDLQPHFETCERDVSVSLLPCPAPPASLKLHDGAVKLGWKSMEVPRWFRHEAGSRRREEADASDAARNRLLTSAATNSAGQRQSMTETYVPRFLRAGGRLLPETRAQRLRQYSNSWVIEARHRVTGNLRIAADIVFVCAGAVHTPTLLLRSGITRNVGKSLQVHPTVKIVARFNETVNAADMGVPVHQVKEFSPRLSFGCSISSPAYLALGLIDHPEAALKTASTWQQMAIYYAMITSEGRGTVRKLPGFRDPLVRYSLTEADRRNLGDGLRKLAQILFESGATELYPGLTRGPGLRCGGCLSKLPEVLPNGLASLMTIHLFSSCPMGENRAVCATDSFGRVHGFKNLFVNDASLLCTAPGVNPQGSIMALARRNALKFLDK